MFWVPIRVQVSYSHSVLGSEKLYIRELSSRKLGFTINSGSLALRSLLGPGRVLFGLWSGPVQVIFRTWSGYVQIPLKFLVSFLQRCLKPFAIVCIQVLFGILWNHLRSVYRSSICAIKSSPALLNSILSYFPMLQARHLYSLVDTWWYISIIVAFYLWTLGIYDITSYVLC